MFPTLEKQTLSAVHSLKLVFVIIIGTFLILGSGGINGPSGGVAGGSGSSASSGSSTSDANAAIGLVAGAAIGTYIYKKMMGSNNNTKQQHSKQHIPTFKVEGRSNRLWRNENAAYVVFTTKANLINKTRHVAFCNSIRNRFPSSAVSTTTKAIEFPTLWPTVNSFFTDENTCQQLVAIYDDEFSTRVMHESNLPTKGQGPLLVASSNQFKPATKLLYWDFSDYETNEFQRQLAHWFDITSLGTGDMEKELLDVASIETIRKGIMKFGEAPTKKPTPGLVFNQ